MQLWLSVWPGSHWPVLSLDHAPGHTAEVTEWKLTAVVYGEETYTIEADSADEARAVFQLGHAPEPEAFEVTSVEDVRVERYGDDGIVRPRKPGR